MKPWTCPDCSSCVRDHRCAYPGLVTAMRAAGVEPTEHDERMLRWMARWDTPTIAWFRSCVERASATTATARLAELDAGLREAVDFAEGCAIPADDISAFYRNEAVNVSRLRALVPLRTPQETEE